MGCRGMEQRKRGKESDGSGVVKDGGEEEGEEERGDVKNPVHVGGEDGEGSLWEGGRRVRTRRAKEVRFVEKSGANLIGLVPDLTPEHKTRPRAR